MFCECGGNKLEALAEITEVFLCCGSHPRITIWRFYYQEILTRLFVSLRSNIMPLASCLQQPGCFVGFPIPIGFVCGNVKRCYPLLNFIQRANILKHSRTTCLFQSLLRIFGHHHRLMSNSSGMPCVVLPQRWSCIYTGDTDLNVAADKERAGLWPGASVLLSEGYPLTFCFYMTSEAVQHHRPTAGSFG